MPGQEQIFTSARAVINNLTARLIANHGFSFTEARWRKTMVNKSETPEENEVKFIVSNKVKELIEKEHDLNVASGHKENMSFATAKESSAWEISVKALGVESYYFARMLYYGISKLGRKQREKDKLDCKLINMYIEIARANSMGLPKKIKISCEDNEFSLSAGEGDNAWFTSFGNIDKLCAYIGREFRGHVEL